MSLLKRIEFLALCLIVMAVSLNSCVNYKNIPYFKDLNAVNDTSTTIANYKSVLIQKDDLLGIYVSSLSPEASALFNYNLSPLAGVNTSNSPVTGYLVDQNGEIQLPLVGSLKVEGLTTTEVRELIKTKLDQYLKETVVNLRIINFKVSVLGDVARPGVYTIQNERITLTEALSLAGDMSITAKRNNVLLVREVDGKRKYIRFDLNKKDIFESPYYYLNNNDVIYVQPGNAKYAAVDNTYRNLSILLSAISVISIILLR